MCVSFGPAIFTATVVCLSQAADPVTGRPVLVMIYSNTAQSDGPNAMLLHIPTRRMEARQVIDTSPFPNIAKDLVAAVEPRATSRAVSFGGLDAAKSVAVFDRGMYTCVLAERARDIPAALARVPEDKRPPANREIFEAYDHLFPGYAHLLCCFKGGAAIRPDPVMCFYEPSDGERVMLPALDAHTGRAPDLKALVDVDHWGIVGAREQRHQHMYPVRYRDGHKIPDDVRALLPTFAMGRKYTGKLANGDFVGDRRKVFSEGPGHFSRGLLTA